MDINKNFSERVKALRLSRKLTQKELANYLRVSITQISDIEKGKTLTSIERLTALAVFFGVSTDYLVGLTSDPSPKDTITIAQSFDGETKTLLELFAKLPSDYRHEVIGYANALSSRR